MASRQPTSRYFEESERYVREYEMKNGLGREYLDQERRAHGTPIRTPIAPDYSRTRTDGTGTTRRHPARSVYPPRQSSVPPARTPPSYADYAANTDVYGGLHSPQPPTPNFLQYTTRPGSPKEVVGVGEIINTETGFTIQLDVRHFSAKEIRVVLCGHTLTIAGERVDEDPATEQTLKRSFSRKYAIPSDVLLDSIKAHLTDFGLLLIRGNRKNWRETEIEIQIQTPDSEVNGEKPRGQPADGESKPPARSPTPPKDDRELRGPSSEVGDSVVVVQPTPILSELSLQRSKELEVHPLLVRPVVAVQYTPSKRGSHFGVV
ncbi:Heat shock protein Hsp-16.48/Hsp-16.49 [Aphelenchoides fujianensis]|nr:Heat shock protein Hsp-16.48/Hsp-16.49 [Aphelenchoides fujianensis]